MTSIAQRIASLDWNAIEEQLDARGCATTGAVLTRAECAGLSSGYASDEHFRSRIVMARHGFGRGEYKYYAYPLPDIVASLRGALYSCLAPVANRWQNLQARRPDFPAQHE